MKLKRIPYTYLIGWTKFDIWYYGSQYGKKANPENLWKTYWTSSNKVKEFTELYGDPDVIQIRKTFKDVKQCRYFEQQIILRAKLHIRSNFLNLHPGNGKFYVKPGTLVWWNNGEIEIKQRKEYPKPGDDYVSGRLKRRWWNDGNNNKMSTVSPGENWSIGRLHLGNYWYKDEDEIRTNTPPDSTWYPGRNPKNTKHLPGRVFSNETRNKMSNSAKNRREREAREKLNYVFTL